MKKFAIILLALMMTTAFASCGETKTLHCDGCGAEVEVDADSTMDEDWTLYCKDCEKEKGLDTLVVTE